MPAVDDELAITKLVTVYPGNAQRELPTIQDEVVVMEARTGTRLGILDGGAATARRTAALSHTSRQKGATRATETGLSGSSSPSAKSWSVSKSSAGGPEGSSGSVSRGTRLAAP